MKVIDLLNKIANREEVPDKIKCGDLTYTYEEYCVGDGKKISDAVWRTQKGYRATINGTYHYLYFGCNNLNDEVKIIENSKKIKKLNAKGNYIEDEEVLTKINELIEEVNKLKFEKVKCSSITISGGIIPNSNVTRLNGDNVTYTMSDQVDI